MRKRGGRRCRRWCTSTSTTWTRSTGARWLPARRASMSRRTCRTATAVAGCGMRAATCGGSPRASRTSRMKRSCGVSRRATPKRQGADEPLHPYPLRQPLEPRVPVQRLELRVDLQEGHRVRVLLVRALEPVDGAVVLAERDVDLRDLVRRAVLARREHLREQLPRPLRLTERRVRARERGDADAAPA